MNLNRLKANAGLLVSALALSFSLQSCSKDNALNSPTPSAAATAQKAVTTLPFCKSVCLVAGQHAYVGTVETVMDGGDLLVTYRSSVAISEVHVDVFATLGAFEMTKNVRNGNPVPGQFAYSQTFASNPAVFAYTVTVPASVISALPDQFFVVAHAALANGETAWGGLCTEGTAGTVSLAAVDQFPGKNWATYFSFNKRECDRNISFTYAWEDLNNMGNDMDYNDLVMQSKVLYTNTANVKQLDLTFFSKARGAAYDHKFKFRILKAGVDGVYHAVMDDMTVTSDATYYYVTVFESTKQTMPGTPAYANTVAGEPCGSPVSKTVTLKLNSSFVYNNAKPFEPFISVYVSGNALSGPSNYDLYIKEVTDRPGQDVFAYTAGGPQYPNGIVIPADWRWPVERQNISGPYPSSLSSSFAPGWHSNTALNYLALTYSPCFLVNP